MNKATGFLIIALFSSAPAWGLTCPFPAGPSPSGAAPAVVAFDSVHRRVYAVHRGIYGGVAINNDGLLPTNRVSVLEQSTGQIITTIPVGKSVNGQYQGIAVDPTRNKIFVGNEDDKTISIIDSTTNSVISTMQIGQSPKGIAVDSSLGRVYVASGSTIFVLNADSGSILTTIPLSNAPYLVTVDAASHMVYACAPGGPNLLFAIDGQTNSVIGQSELSLLLSPQGIANSNGLVYVTFHDSNTVSVVNVTTPGSPRETRRISTGTGFAPAGIAADSMTGLIYVTIPNHNVVEIFDSAGALVNSIGTRRLPVAIAIDSSARRAYVADAESDSLTVIDLDLQTANDTWILGNSPWGIAFEPATKRLYVANSVADSISVLDTTTGNVSASWYSGAGPWKVAVDETLQQVYAANATDNTLSVIDSSNGKIKATIAVAAPATIAVSPATHYVYVTSGPNSLSVVDGNTLTLLATIPVGQKPSGVAVDDTSRLVYVANQQSGSISVIDADTNNLISTFLPPEGNVWSIAVDHLLGRLYMTCPLNTIGSFTGVEILDAVSGNFIGKTATGNNAEQVVVDTSTHKVFVTDSHGGTVDIIDGSSGAINSVIQASGASDNAQDMSIDHDAWLLYVSNPLEGSISCVDISATQIFSLSVNINPSGKGSVSGAGISCPAGCSSYYANATGVTLTATAASGYRFSGWNGCDAPSGNICTLDMTADKCVTANFAATTCANLPAERMGGTPIYYYTLQDAYNAANAGDVIMSQAVVFNENPVFNRGITVTLRGGYDCTYTTGILKSTINGSMTVSSGTVTVDNIIVQ